MKPYKTIKTKFSFDITAIPKGVQNIEQDLKHASLLVDAGKLFEADKILLQILQSYPNNPHATHLMGVLNHLVGRHEIALKLIEKAISMLPTEAYFHRNIGEMYRLLKRFDQAISHNEQAVQLAPLDAIALSNLGIVWYDLKQYEKARACQQNALKMQADLVQALNNLGSICRETKNKEGAVGFYQKALEISPGYILARNNLGAVLTELDRPEDALPELDLVLKANPRYADAHCNVGNAFFALDELDKAMLAFTNSLNLSPYLMSAVLGQARVLKSKYRLDDALTMVQRAFEIDSENAEVYCLLGEIHLTNEDYEASRQAFNKSIEMDPISHQAILGIGQLELEMGHQEEAQDLFKRAMEIAPQELSPHVFMVQARKTKSDDPTFIRLEREALSIQHMPPTKAMSVHFGLGKAYDDQKQYDLAFPHFLQGCQLKRRRVSYDADDEDLLFANIKRIFTQSTIDQLSGYGDKSDLPIFVLGMPRSGTTLVETILGSHPDVTDAGELPDLLKIVNRARAYGESAGYPLSIVNITSNDLTKMGATYIEGLKKRYPDAKRITDKLPANFLALGLIHLILPNAKIIHVNRNPVDTCLSGFTKLFNNDNQPYSYDLKELGRYYLSYARLMDHWKAVLPKDAFLDVQYEELVADSETQTRRLIDFCELPWNDACLEHHKSKRTVKTASITQVRQPVYQTSVERWRQYEKHLGPLLDALAEFTPKN